MQYDLWSEVFSLMLAQLLYFSVECEFAYTVQNPLLRQVHFGIYPGCDICLGAKNVQVTLLQFFDRRVNNNKMNAIVSFSSPSFFFL